MTEKETDLILTLPLEDIVNIMIMMETALWLLKEHLNDFETSIAEINELKNISDLHELENEKKITKLKNKTKVFKSLYLSRVSFVDSLTVKINKSGIDIDQEVLKHLKENGSQWRTE